MKTTGGMENTVGGPEPSWGGLDWLSNFKLLILKGLGGRSATVRRAQIDPGGRSDFTG
jgi:hypothetical protein